MKIRFLVACDDDMGRVYQLGEVVDLNDASANHWLIRGKAEKCVTKKGRPKKVIEPEKPKPEKVKPSPTLERRRIDALSSMSENVTKSGYGEPTDEIK